MPLLEQRDLRKHLKMHSGEKLNKCNQCDYASSQAGHLRRHLKTHSGKKSNKCNHCYYASSRRDTLRRHLKAHISGKTETCIISGRQLEGTFENPYQQRKCKNDTNPSLTHPMGDTHPHIHTLHTPTPHPNTSGI